MPVLVSLLWVWMAATPAHAGHVEIDVVADGFDLSQDLEYDIEATLSRTHHWLSEELALDLSKVDRVEILIVASRAKYLAMEAEAGFRPESTAGFFSNRTGAVVWRSPDPAQIRRTAVHEVVHHFVRSAGGSPPRWLGEGISEVFERFRVKGNAVYLDPDERILRWLKAGGDRGYPTIDFYLDADRAAWQARGGPYHRWGWALTAFLLRSEPGRRAVIRLLRAGRDPAPGVQRAAVADAYHGGAEQLASDWEAWYRGIVRPMNLPLQPATITPAAETVCDGILMMEGGKARCMR